MPKGDHVEEVSMMDFENTKGSSSRKVPGAGAGASSMFREMEGSDDEEEEGGMPQGQQFACNTQ